MSADKIMRWPGHKLDFTSGTLIMGILNVTPDSFSDGGRFLDTSAAVQRGIQMAAEGAVVIDIGGESTRPGAEHVAAAEQIQRTVPVIKQLAKKIDIPISIDSRNYEVTRAAIDAGASIVNDITALADERTAKLAAEKQLPVVLMHTKGTPEDMQTRAEYKDVVTEVLDFLLSRADYAQSIAIKREHIFIDPGIGFAKTAEHNIQILRHIDRFVKTGYHVLVGASRKAFIGKLTGVEKASERILGTAATVSICAGRAVSMVRVHDVAEMAQVIKVTRAINCRTD